MTSIIAETLTLESFAPFGQVLEQPVDGARTHYNKLLENARSNANVDLSIARIPPTEASPITLRKMERHPWSSQTFIPMQAGRFLIIVAPDDQLGGPDMEAARAFIASGNQAITYRLAVWHHGMTVLDETATMAVLMWCNGGNGDEEFVDIASPIDVLFHTPKVLT